VKNDMKMNISGVGMRVVVVHLSAGVHAAKFLKLLQNALHISTLSLNPSVRIPADIYRKRNAESRYSERLMRGCTVRLEFFFCS
jgi:hypothetical protein